MDLLEDIEKSSKRICSHMNRDHITSVRAYVDFYTDETDTAAVIMSGVNAQGFLIEVTKTDGSKKEVIAPYPEKLEAASQIHKFAIDMHKKAFAGLGVVYRVRNGYYMTPIKMISKALTKKAQKYAKYVFWVALPVLGGLAFNLYLVKTKGTTK